MTGTPIPTLNYYILVHNPKDAVCGCDRCFATMMLGFLESIGRSAESMALELEVPVADILRDLHPTTTDQGVAVFLN